jgi:hypothetical protein
MPLDPTFQELLDAVIKSRLLEVHTAIPGKVVSYDEVTQTAEVAPVVQRAEPKEDGGNTLTPLPSIPNVPVQWPRGGRRNGLLLPLSPGDHVLLVFSEAATGHWRASGELAPPGDLRRHSLGYPIAIPGIEHEGAAMDGASQDEARMIVDQALAVGDAVGVSNAQPVMVADAFMQAMQAGLAAVAPAAVAVGAGGATAAFTAFVGAFQAALISSSKLKAQFP